MTTIENKIETEQTEIMIAPPATKIIIKKKIETKIQEQSIPKIEAEMNTEVKEKKPRQKKTKMVIEEDPVDTIPEPEPIVPAYNKVYIPTEEEEEAEAEAHEEQAVADARVVLEKAERKKLENDIRANITDHRKTSCDQIEKQRQEILTKIQALNAENSALQAKLVDTHEGKLDDEIIAIQLVKNKKTKGKREIKLHEYVRPPNYASQYIPADTILTAKLGFETWKIKYDGNKFINEECGTEYETLRKATIAFTLATNKKSIPDAWTFWKTTDGKKINRLDLNPL